MTSDVKPLFRFEADRAPTMVILALFVADLGIFFLVENRYLVVAWMLLGVVPKICICSWNHHHQHLHTFYKPVLNRLLEIVYTFHTGITTNAWVLHHVLGHHINYLDQEKDESKWMRADGTTMGTIEYTTKLAASGYPTAIGVGRRFPRYLRGLFGIGAITLALLAWMFTYNWFNALFIFALPMVIGYLATCWATYYHHAGLDTENHFEASYNIMNKWYNIATGNLGYHTAHHVKPGLHWSKLPEYHASIVDKIPAHLYRQPFFPFRWFPG
jgi:fatty acid desaturase